jgi:hypothetical protein
MNLEAGICERAVAKVYPSLWMRRFPRGDRGGDEQAAYAVAEWLQRADQSGSLGSFLNLPQEKQGALGRLPLEIRAHRGFMPS